MRTCTRARPSARRSRRRSRSCSRSPVVEVVGGVIAGSLALLADAVHMAADAGSLGLALGAAWLARRPPTLGRSFGFARAEILAALTNGAALVALAIWIFVEAGRRLAEPARHPCRVGARRRCRRARGQPRGGARALASRWREPQHPRCATPRARRPARLARRCHRGAGRARRRLGAGRPARVDPDRRAGACKRLGGAAGVRRHPARIRSCRVWTSARSGMRWRHIPAWSGFTTSTCGRSRRAFPSLSAHVIVQRDVDCHAIRTGSRASVGANDSGSTTRRFRSTTSRAC